MELGKVGSGLDVSAIVSALVNADVAPRNNSINRREADLKAELTAVGTLKSSLTQLDASLEDLTDGSAFDQITIEAPTEVDVVQTGSPADGQYSINVSALAASQVVASGGFASATATVGTGTLTIEVGTPTYASGSSGPYSAFSADASKTVTVTIDSSNNTLAGIRDAINASAAGVTASLVVDGSQTRLLYTSDTSGASTAISVTVDDDDGNDSDGSNLSALGYGLSAGFSNMTEARSAQDAAFSLNGLALTNSSNTINGLVDGLDVTLKKVTSGTEMITVKSDSAAIERTVQSFVDAYNSYQSTLSSLMDYQSIAGALSGDSTARRIQSAIRAGTTGQLDLASNAYTMLSQLGITADRYGKLTLSSTEFQSALSANASDVKEFFAGATITSNLSDNTNNLGLTDKLREIIETYTDNTSGMLASRETRINDSLRDLEDDKLSILARMESLEERYTRQFTAMDTLVSQLQGTSDFLSNQMDALKAQANR